MKNKPKNILTSHASTSSLATAAVLTLTMAFATQAYACDACNLTFADQVLTGERADTPLGRDARQAMENHRNLRLDGFANASLVDAQNAKLDSVNSLVASVDRSLSPDEQIQRETGTRLRNNSSPRNTLQTNRFPMPEYMKDAPFQEILERDYQLSTRPYSTVPQDAPVDKSFTIKLNEGSVYIGNGILYEGFLMDGSIPGQTIIVDEGDVVEMIVENTGIIPHGMSIHAAYTQTSKYVGSIGARSSKSVRFRAMTPGVYMYHCAPGGHAIGMHVLGGQYGMIVVRPKPGSYQLERELGHEPDVELFLIQHELYATGKDAIEGSPEYVMFNGRTFRYIEEPIVTKPGDYVRINFLNVGPNLLSTFHIVGIIWDYVYWQGHPDAKLPGGQTVTAGPSDSFVIEFRMPPDEGAYTMLSHAVGSTNRGAIGLLIVDAEAETEPHRKILANGPTFSDSEINRYRDEATRIIAPFGIGTHPKDRPVIYGPEVKEVNVSIIGNSFHPKVIQVAPGTTVTWTNEDAFTYMAGEYSGVHNAAGISAPPEDEDGFVTPLLVHGESYSHRFDYEWEYDYICTPHPYMLGRVIVKEPEYSLAGAGGSVSLGNWVLPLLGLCLLMSSASLVLRGRRSE